MRARFDEREVRLRDFDREPGVPLHSTSTTSATTGITPSKSRSSSPSISHRSAAACIDGARARPPEDVGGVPGYERFLAIIADPDDPEHADTKRWCGGHFDPEWFDPRSPTKTCKNALKPNVRRRLHQPRPKRPKPSS